MLWAVRMEMAARHVAVFKFKAKDSSLPHSAKDDLEAGSRERGWALPASGTLITYLLTSAVAPASSPCCRAVADTEWSLLGSSNGCTRWSTYSRAVAHRTDGPSSKTKPWRSQ